MSVIILMNEESYPENLTAEFWKNCCLTTCNFFFLFILDEDEGEGEDEGEEEEGGE